MTITDPYGFIYITTNLIDGKRYIGQKKFDSYWKSYLGSGKHLREAVKKYGKENFSRNIVAIAYSKEELDDAEIIVSLGSLEQIRAEIITILQRAVALKAELAKMLFGMVNNFLLK